MKNSMTKIEIDIKEPTERAKKLVNEYQNLRGWKFPPQPFTTTDGELAEEYNYALQFYHGGSEMSQQGKYYVVTTKGYYHYVGA